MYVYDHDKTVRLILVFSLVIIFTANEFPLFAHSGHGHTVNTSAPASAAPASAADLGSMGVNEKPGAMVPLDLPFITEHGDTILLKDVLKGPTILAILYYKCPNACNLLLTGIANVLRSITDQPGKAPNVLCLSVDERETPADAVKAKSMAFEAIEKPFPDDHWHFLTGSAASIKKTTDAAGFRFVRRGEEFDHPLCLIVLSPQGKVTRYIMGTDYLPIDITMSLMEASAGTVRPTVARVLRACFSYEPKSHRYVFNVLRVSATVIFSLLGIFIVYLVISGRIRHVRAKQ